MPPTASADPIAVGKMERSRDPSARRVAIGAGALAALIAFVATARYGIGVSPDSVVYMWAAKNFAAGNGLRILDGAPLVHWGPLYSAVLALALRLGIGAETAARIIGCIGFGVFVALAALWLRRHVRSRGLWWLSVAATMASTAVFDVFTYAWSETLLLILVAAFLLDADAALERDDRGAWVRLAAYAALASLVRYAGATLAVTGALLLLADGRRALGSRLARAVAFGAASLAPLALWLWRNKRVAGAPFGERPASGYSLLEVLAHMLDALGQMFLSSLVPMPMRLAIVLIGLAVLAIALFRAARGLRRPLLPALVFIVVYLALLVVWTASVAADRASERYVAPVFLPLLGVIFAVIAAAMPSGWREGARPVRRKAEVALIALALWLPFPAARTLLHAGRAWTDGVPGYTDRHWRESALGRELAARPLGGVVYSNAPDAYFHFVGGEARLSPRRTYYYTTQAVVPGELDAFADSIGAHREGAWLVWFLETPRSFLRHPVELEEVTEVTPTRTATDGIVYRLAPRVAAERAGGAEGR